MATCAFEGCKKSVNVLAFECRCKWVFCAKHRLPADHACEFDFKAAGRDRIAADNPKVVAERVCRV